MYERRLTVTRGWDLDGDGKAGQPKPALKRTRSRTRAAPASNNALHVLTCDAFGDWCTGGLLPVIGLLSKQVNDALKKHIKPRDLTVMMVCTAEPLVDEIRALPGVGEVVIHPYDQNWPHPDGYTS